MLTHPCPPQTFFQDHIVYACCNSTGKVAIIDTENISSFFDHAKLKPAREGVKIAAEAKRFVEEAVVKKGGVVPFFIEPDFTVSAYNRTLVNYAIEKKGWKLERVPRKLFNLLTYNGAMPPREADTPEYDWCVGGSMAEIVLMLNRCPKYQRDECATCGAAGRGVGKTETRLERHLACSKCSLVWYCSRECQKAHWNAGHKVECETLGQAIGISVLDAQARMIIRG